MRSMEGYPRTHCLCLRRIFTLQAYGQTFITDDRFFSIVGSCASALNAVSGMIWGWVADRYTFKVSLSPLNTVSGMIWFGDKYTFKVSLSPLNTVSGMIWVGNKYTFTVSLSPLNAVSGVICYFVSWCYEPSKPLGIL